LIIDHETLGLLLRQLYGLPVEIPSTLMSNGLELPIVSFEEAQRVNYHLDPFLHLERIGMEVVLFSEPGTIQPPV
jgi:hypothetical protein